MNKFNKIPVSFKIAGQDIKVEYVRFLKDGTTLGMCCLYTSSVIIANECTTDIITDDSKLNTFYHELIHLILDQYGYYNLSESERFVEQLSSLLTSWYKSCKTKLIYINIDFDLNDIFNSYKNVIKCALEIINYKEPDIQNLINFISIGLLEFEETAIYKY